jgi:predicted amidophosphoribosyltransferase
MGQQMMGGMQSAQQGAAAAQSTKSQCVKCNQAIPVGSRFCSHCGTPQGALCSKCQSPIAPNAKFCSNCGAQQGESMQCSKCKNPIEPGAKFCPKCGNPVE